MSKHSTSCRFVSAPEHLAAYDPRCERCALMLAITSVKRRRAGKLSAAMRRAKGPTVEGFSNGRERA